MHGIHTNITIGVHDIKLSPAAYYKKVGTNWNGIGLVKMVANAPFKDMVKAFHKEGIAVIMDVVYNHLSEYEIGNLVY